MISPEKLYKLVEVCIKEGNYIIRDKGMLKSIVHNAFYFSRDPIDVVLKIFYDIITLHPLVDGNKRTAVCFLISALDLLGYDVYFTNYELLEIALGVATNKISLHQLKRILMESIKRKSFPSKLV